VGAGVAHEIKAWKTQFDRHFAMPALMASGLFAFGIYSLLEAVYRRIEP